MKNFDLKLYLISDSNGMTEDEFFKRCESALKGGITMLQLREKEMCSGEFAKRAIKLRKLCSKYNVPLIINDRIDIALVSDADGVHLGQDDIPVDMARKILGNDRIIGCTAKTVEAGIKARDMGADYIGSGAIYASSTKEEAKVTPVETINKIAEKAGLPVTAIGGINRNNLEILRNSRVSGIAVSSAIIKADDVEKETRETLLALNGLFC